MLGLNAVFTGCKIHSFIIYMQDLVYHVCVIKTQCKTSNAVSLSDLFLLNGVRVNIGNQDHQYDADSQYRNDPTNRYRRTTEKN